MGTSNKNSGLMKALEFESQVNPDKSLAVPPDIACQLPAYLAVRVILLLPEREETEWASLTEAEFLGGYGSGDSIYDNL